MGGGWSGGVHGVGAFMEGRSICSVVVDGVWEWRECGSGWSVGVEGVWEWVVVEWMDCMGVWVQF